MELIDRAIHRGFDAGCRAALLNFAHHYALQSRDHAVHCVGRAYFEIASAVVLDRAVDIDHVFAVRAPSEHLIEKRAFALAENRIALDAGWDREALAAESEVAR